MEIIRNIEITSSGGTETLELAANAMVTTYVIKPDATPFTLANPLVINFDQAFHGASIEIVIGQMTFGVSGAITINGVSVSAAQAALGRTMKWRYYNGAWEHKFVTSCDALDNIDGDVLIDYTTALSKLAKSTAGNMIVFNASQIATSVAMSGVIAINSSGVTTFNGSPITDTHIALSAAIQRIKLAAGTAGHVVYNDDTTGLMTSEAYLATKRGGLGNTFAAATGFLKFDTGVASASAMEDVREKFVSFEADALGNYYIKWPVDVTVTNIEARVVTNITDSGNGELELMDNSGALMIGSALTAGVLYISTGSTTGIGFTSTLTGNNVFLAGERMRIISNKSAGGGSVNVEVTYTRNS